MAAAAIAGAAAASAAAPAPRTIRLYARERPADWRGFLHFLVDHRFRGMIVEGTNGPWLRVAAEIHKAGLELAVSPAFPHPAPFVDEDGDDEEEEGRGELALRRAVSELLELGAVELHCDFENNFEKAGQKHRRVEAAGALRAVKIAHPNFRIVVTSYPSFPIDEFVEVADEGSTQVYDRFDNQPLTFAATWVGRWKRKGFKRVRAGTGIYKLTKDAAGKTIGVPKPIARQRAYLDSIPAGTDADVWTMRDQQLNFRAYAAHYAELRRFAEI